MTLSGTFLRSRDRVHSPSGGSGSALRTVGTLLIRLSGQGSGPGTAHFLLRLCKSQAGPSGNGDTVEESPASRAELGGSLEGTRRTREGCTWREWERASKSNVYSRPGARGARIPKFPLAVALFFQSPRGEAGAAEDNGIGWVGPALQHLRGSDLGRTSKAGGEQQQSRWRRSSGPFPPPYPSPPACDLRPPSRTHGELARGQGGDVKGIPLSSHPRAAWSFPRICSAHSPPPPPQTCFPAPTRICLGAHGSFPIDLSVLPPALAFPASKTQKPAGNHPAFAWSLRGPRISVAPIPPCQTHGSPPTRVNFCAR
nr:uncharacterized protein LOC103237687 [Chlorocebus sabaeus]